MRPTGRHGRADSPAYRRCGQRAAGAAHVSAGPRTVHRRRLPRRIEDATADTMRRHWENGKGSLATRKADGGGGGAKRTEVGGEGAGEAATRIGMGVGR